MKKYPGLRARGKYTEVTEKEHTTMDESALPAGVLDTPASALDVQVGGGHYRGYAIQPVEFIHANSLPFIEGSCIKYLVRWRDKGGVADLLKVKHYVDLLIELETRK